MRRLLLAAAFVGLAVPATVQADDGYLFTIVSQDAMTGAEIRSEVSVLGIYLKVRIFEGDRLSGIMTFNGADGEMLAHDPGTRKYFRMTREMANQMGAMLGAGRGALEQAMAAARQNMSEEDLQRMRDAGIPGFGGGDEPEEEPDFTFAGTSGSGDSPLGPCEWNDYNKGGELAARYCLVNRRVDGFEESKEAFRAMGEFMQEVLSAMSAGAQIPGLGNNPMEHMDRFDNVPGLIEQFEGGRQVGTAQVVSVERVDLTEADFGPEEGYTAQEFGIPGR